uniref:Thymic stromal lymphopoietin n=1 Tax=Nannospalax galili TaxID=1026970 RepID=A0A8C6W929_NANGA
MVFFRKLFVLQLVGLVLTYNFSNCDFKKIVIIYDEIISEDLGGKFTQIQPCYNATDCLMKIEHQTFNPASGCPSLPRKPFAIKTKSTLTLHCPGYSGTQRNTTNQKTGKDIERNCRNQMLQIIAWWRHFCQIPK